MENYNYRKNLGENHPKFPFTQDTVDNLKPCRIVNPRVGNNHGIKPDPKFNLKESSEEIARVALEVKQGIFPFWFMEKYYPYKNIGSFPKVIPEPLKAVGLSFDNPQGLADVVHMDSPILMPLAVHEWLTHPKHGQNVNINNKNPNYINFVETIPNMIRKIAIGMDDGLEKAFDIKWFYGCTRPEEYFEHVNNISGALMTAYTEGCPPHSSFIAGHTGAALGGGKPILDNFSDNMSQYHLKQVLDSLYCWIMFRPFAGMHHAMDQLAGYALFGYDDYVKKTVINKYKI